MSPTWTREEQRQHRAMWVAALPSYTQGRKALREGDCFCVLGAGCDVAAPALGLCWEAATASVDGLFTIGGHLVSMPNAVADYFGVNPRGTYHGGSLIRLNTETTFAEIAALIAAEPEGLCET